MTLYLGKTHFACSFQQMPNKYHHVRDVHKDQQIILFLLLVLDKFPLLCFSCHQFIKVLCLAQHDLNLSQKKKKKLFLIPLSNLITLRLLITNPHQE